MLVEVREVEDGLVTCQLVGFIDRRGSYIRNKSSLQYTQQRSRPKKARTAREPKLRGSDDRPENHLCWYPAIRPHPLTDKLRR